MWHPGIGLPYGSKASEGSGFKASSAILGYECEAQDMRSVCGFGIQAGGGCFRQGLALESICMDKKASA